MMLTVEQIKDALEATGKLIEENKFEEAEKLLLSIKSWSIEMMKTECFINNRWSELKSKLEVIKKIASAETTQEVEVGGSY